MGYIAEPDGVDFIIKSKPLTQKEEKELIEFIRKRKAAYRKQKKSGSD